ncbi:hypothetical protein EJ06DRAFT_553008 [Trichodelitschia bisporula]|uniref:Uncharacterized protein n=1 Tax=Trichodelitschia bisporula TaxID=703511 RepID=A0A6G1I7V1_9PEZI|nr:hypothetical protein EJ06DRAFT_553008 [Trichodelitschia bisporula]
MADQLYVIKRTLTDRKDPSGTSHKTAVKGVYTSLGPAKAAAASTLADEGYERAWFPEYAVRGETPGDWPYGDGVIVHAVAPEGEEFSVAIDTVANELNLQGDEQGLWAVRRELIDYDADRSGDRRETQVQGAYKTQEAANAAAKQILLGDALTPADWEEYDEFQEGEEWDWGDEVIVHAVGTGGENILVYVSKIEK